VGDMFDADLVSQKKLRQLRAIYQSYRYFARIFRLFASFLSDFSRGYEESGFVRTQRASNLLNDRSAYARLPLNLDASRHIGDATSYQCRPHIDSAIAAGFGYADILISELQYESANKPLESDWIHLGDVLTNFVDSFISRRLIAASSECCESSIS
jgi:hypothetical protein